MGEGFITLHRSVQKHWIWQEPEALKFWLALLMQANWEAKTTAFNKRLITVKRGQVVFGRKAWSERLKISEMKLRRYLDMLKAEGMINQQITSRYSLITVLNYDEHQNNNQLVTSKRGNDQPANNQPTLTDYGAELQQTTSKQPANNQLVTTSKQVNNKTVGGKLKKFTPPEISEVQKYCAERKNGIDPEIFVDFYLAKNWMVGKNKMRDWKAAVRTWEKRRREGGHSSPAGFSSQEYFL